MLQDFLSTSLASQLNPAFILSLVAFAVVFALTWKVGRVLRSREDIRRRALYAQTPGADGALADRRSLRHAGVATTGRILASLSSNLIPVDRESVSAMRKELLNAGFFQPTAVARYYLIRMALAVLLPVAAYLAVEFSQKQLTSMKFLLLLFGSSILGLYLPRIFISRRRAALQLQCRQGFPDFMDLMVVCAEAGISMGQAIERVSREILPTYPFLGTCLQLASLELRAGRTLTESFENLAQRLGIEEAHNLGSLLKQSEELGTSLSDALRVYSDEMRDKRMARAEEKAHALPAKLSVPLMVFVFPVILIVILLPAFTRVQGIF